MEPLPGKPVENPAQCEGSGDECGQEPDRQLQRDDAPRFRERSAAEGGSALEQGGPGDRGSGQQETEAGGVGGRDAALAARDDRETGPRDPGKNGRRLRDSDPERIGETAGEQRDRPGPGGVSVGLRGRPPEREEDRAGQHEAPGGKADTAESVVDLVPEREPDDGCRNRRDEQQAEEPPAGPHRVPALGGGPAGSRDVPSDIPKLLSERLKAAA